MAYWGELAQREFDRGEASRKAGAPPIKRFCHKSNSLLYYGAQAAAKLGPETAPGLVFDIAAPFTGGITTKVVRGIVGAVRGTRVAKDIPAVQKTLGAVDMAALGWSTRESKIYQMRKAIKMRSLVKRGIGKGLFKQVKSISTDDGVPPVSYREEKVAVVPKDRREVSRKIDLSHIARLKGGNGLDLRCVYEM
jgi:hypothetical protein